MQDQVQRTGRFEPDYIRFIDALAAHRAKLHRYCSRMTGSPLDGEDVMQDVLFDAYRKMDQLEDGRPVAPWLFRIAHNRCIDLLRRKTVRAAKEAEAAEPDIVPPAEFHGRGVSRALERLVINLPPKERACVLLKDVLGYSLDEIGDLVSTSVGGVKAALHRGRAKLAALPEQSAASVETRKDLQTLHGLYVERFNRQDWDGVRDLVSADARLQITDLYAGPAIRAYFSRFEDMPFPWRLAAGHADGERGLVLLGGLLPDMAPAAIVRLDVTAGKINRIRHYARCPWVFATAHVVVCGAAEVDAAGLKR